VLARLICLGRSADVNFSPADEAARFCHDEVLAKHPSLVYARFRVRPERNRHGPHRLRTHRQGMRAERSPASRRQADQLGIPIATIAGGMLSPSLRRRLFARERDPERARRTSTNSMLGGQAALLTYQAGILFTTGKVPEMIGNAQPDRRAL